MNLINNNVKILLFTLVFCLSLINSTSAQKLVVGYYPDFMKYTVPPSKIEFQHLTHVIHAFAAPKSNGEINTFNMLDVNFNNIVHNAGKKILMGIGGWSQSGAFAVMCANPDSLSAFVHNAVNLTTEYHYDGIDLDWEFPADTLQKVSLTLLVKELRSALDKTDTSLLLTMAVGGNDYSGQYYEYNKIVDYIDWFAMMGYDYHGSWSGRTGHNAPMYQNPLYPDGSVELGIRYLNEARKIPVNKIMLGVPFYGKEFNASGLYKTKSDSIVMDIFYSGIAPRLNSVEWNYFWDSVSMVPYLQDTSHTKFVTFDDTTAMRIKCNYVKNNHLKGIMVWALGQDAVADSQPLLEKISSELLAVSSLISVGNNAVKDFKLYDNFPNPFNSSTRIKFSIPKDSQVNMYICNSVGELIKIIINERLRTGEYEINYSPGEIASGIYFCVLSTNKGKLVKKMIYLK